MNVTIDWENASNTAAIPDEKSCASWVNAAQATIAENLVPTADAKPLSLGIRFVDEPESASLNSTYRNKNYATNVLSFSSELPAFALAEMDERPLGDLVICAPVVIREAGEQNKTEQSHWAHMVIHGFLHLQGFNHANDTDANVMETLEIQIMESLGFADPYLKSASA